MTQILIIDDDPFIRLVLGKILQGQEYDVIMAENGEDGIQQAQQFHPALIVCDWEMPGINGLDVCRQIRADRTLSNTFFILLTGRSTLEDRIEGLDSGADDLLFKPINGSELKARIRTGLNLYRAKRYSEEMKGDFE